MADGTSRSRALRSPVPGLGPPFDERANCGVGVILDLSGEPSHATVRDGLRLLENLDHRGARGAEENTGDGAGILLEKPHRLFGEVVDDLGGPDGYGVGQVFLPADEATHATYRALIDRTAEQRGFTVPAWRTVPTDDAGLGETALDCEPAVFQVFVEPIEPLAPERLDTRLYLLRRAIEAAVAEADPPDRDAFYVCSLDRRTIVYKGLLTNAQLRTYYPDLTDERVASAIVFVHARFSTNTLGAWHLAHPYRTLVHNGEINTIRGNLNWLAAREADLESPAFGDDIELVRHVADADQSDSAILDNVLELLIEAGRSIPHALRMLVPEAWEKNDDLDELRRAWYRYHATITEPWDGPLLVAATDGEGVGAILDRNGLRPCRYHLTADDRLVMASEAGALATPPAEIVETGRLQPGQLFYASPSEGVVADADLFDRLADERYAAWLDSHEVDFAEVMAEATPPARIYPPCGADIDAYHRAFGYTEEDLRRLIAPMATSGSDPIGSMGDDAPLAVLSERNKPLSWYFKQLFAQVSNPPIDHLREDLVTSLEHHVGRQRNLLGESPEHCRQVRLASTVLSRREVAALADLDRHGIRTAAIDLTYERDETTLEAAVEAVCEAAERAIEAGSELLLLTDRDVGPTRVPIPTLLATGAVHHHLVRTGRRTQAGLVLESGQVRTVHQLCTHVGYGADAVCPYLAYESIEAMIRTDALEADRETALDRYRGALEAGLQKVMAKMGISTVASYKGAQIFEAVGLDSNLIDVHFAGTPVRTEGIGLPAIERDLLERHDLAFGAPPQTGFAVDPGGDLYWRRDGEYHQWNPLTIGKLQYAAQADDYDAYREFARLINDQEEHLQTLRGLLAFDAADREPIPLEAVEPVESIVARFFTASMSFGSLSPEAHETLAVAMNRLGGVACSGEGGEPVERFDTERECKNKQVASGRFGVTSAYLQQAEHLEIKMAQGSKPGEGGHLPGEKVNATIAETRSTTPGVPLISPPPHHDIYSIEDLAQLIHDLKCANPAADVHVKLVSEAGVGVIAAGVAKARADAVLISGQSGGTGASPKTSIKHAGLPWELGIAEANQVLLANGLRSRIRVRVDGGLKTGRDVAIAAALGAEEFGFGTAALVTCGCVMLRKCHCNTCSVGIATQDPELRERYAGDPAYIMNYLRHVAREVRELLADLGLRSVDDLVGRTDLLRQQPVDHPDAREVDLSAVLSRPESTDARRRTRTQHHRLEDTLDRTLLGDIGQAIDAGEPVAAECSVTNRDRTIGTMVSHRISAAHGADGLPADTVVLELAGTAGQSLGAFGAPGLTIDLDGPANDYCGKGLSGAKLVVKTPADAGYVAAENVLIGNVALYGATAGEAYVNGRAGERFAVRNSGAFAVVEGIGDHGCEYMTGGVAVVLGSTGHNFAAGMSGGEAYVLDETGDFAERVNQQMVRVEGVDAARDRHLLRRLVENHYRYTGSDRARAILDDWEAHVSSFAKVVPDAYAAVVADRLAAGEDIRVAPPRPAGTGPAEALGDD